MLAPGPAIPSSAFAMTSIPSRRSVSVPFRFLWHMGTLPEVRSLASSCYDLKFIRSRGSSRDLALQCICWVLYMCEASEECDSAAVCPDREADLFEERLSAPCLSGSMLPRLTGSRAFRSMWLRWRRSFGDGGLCPLASFGHSVASEGHSGILRQRCAGGLELSLLRAGVPENSWFLHRF